MEALLFMLNSIVVVLMVFMGLRDDRKPPGVPHTSLFRMRDDPGGSAPAAERSASETPGPQTSGPQTPGPQPAGQPGWAAWEQTGRDTL